MTIALYLAHLNPVTHAHVEIITELQDLADSVKVMPVVFRSGEREINSKSFPFDYSTRKKMLESVFGNSISITDDYAFEAPFKKYLPPLVRSRSWRLKRQILHGVKGEYFSYTGDRAEGYMLKIYGLHPRVGQRKQISATSVKEKLFDSALNGGQEWKSDVPKKVAEIINESWGVVEKYAGIKDLTTRVAGMKFPKEGWSE
ncbi:MAG: hypothetical protein D9C04_00770 [Nitrosopumilus sp. B06]|nr:MAG: hypothetical protein EB828_06145 [Nitrosopumilus sp. D6]RNJ80597.1 MAG: hypothetical protein D9C04_00770 [Nitrosopumilus sp. B06]